MPTTAEPTHVQTDPTLSLTQLQAEESIIAARKANVRRFGAGWLRPPGITKTLQALQDEAQERAEQEEMQRREQAIMEQMAAEEERVAREGMAGEDDGMEERDLDEDIPEAEEDASEDGSEEEEDSEEDVTFEESALEGSVGSDVQRRLELEEAEMSGAAADARDLDDDVPEAGSYEHTDSELEDSSEEEQDLDDEIPEAEDLSMAEMSALSANLSNESVGLRVSGHSFLSDTGSSVPGSSFLDNSPVAGRGRGGPTSTTPTAGRFVRRLRFANPNGRGS